MEEETISEGEHRPRQHQQQPRDYHSTSTGKGDSNSTRNDHLEDYIYELVQHNGKMSTNSVDTTATTNHHRHLNGEAELSSPSNTSSYPFTNIINSSSQPNNNYDHDDIDALRDQLVQRDKDVTWVAQIGNALLNRNEELTKMNEEISKEYTRNLEILEQEKYALRKKLNTIEIEYDNKMHELQTDLHSARTRLSTIIEGSKQNEQEQAKLIDELTQQNQRLTAELKRSSNHETELEREIQSLKEQYQARRINFSDHLGQIEGLRDEINLLSRRKLELETKISALNDERETISLTLDESQYKVLQLEKHLQEKDMLLENRQQELDELRRMNTHYQNRLDTIIKNRSFDNYRMQGSSLLNEIEMCSNSSGEENNFHQHSPNYLSEDEMLLDMTSVASNKCKHCKKYKHEILGIYVKLKQLFDELYKRRMSEDMATINTSSTASTSPLPTLNGNVTTNINHHHHRPLVSLNHDSGIQSHLTTFDEVGYLICDIQELVKNFDSMQCLSCLEFNAERNELERTRKQCQKDHDTIQQLNSQIVELTSRLTITETKLDAAEEESSKLKTDLDDIANSSPDEIIKRAWRVRDDVMARKNTVEIELAKVRIELMNVNSQLLETIQQKVELSQQLEQWQVDMETLIDEQLRSKLSQQEKQPPTAAELNTTTSNKQNLFERFKFPKLLRYP